MPAILGIDAGTTSSRALVFAEDGHILAVAQREFRQIYPRPGWVEHDAKEIWRTQIEVSAEAVKKANVPIGAIGITNQRETTVLWDRETGEPIANAIVWQDRRTAEMCDALREHEALIRARTGLVIDAYFSGTKIRWLLESGGKPPHSMENLAFGTIDSWIVWNLTGGRAHLTDVTNASRTMLFDIHRAAWDDELLSIVGVPRSILPGVRSSSELFAYTADGLPIPAGIPIMGIAGDQQAALFGQRCTRAGMAKNTYGTGSFVVMNTGDAPVTSSHGLLATIAWRIGDEPLQYALEGSIFVTGAAVQWLRDGLGIIKTAAEIEELASSVPDSGGVVVVPAFTGLGTPHWDAYARGAILGLTRGSTAAHVARATLESIALQTTDVLEAMHDDSGIALSELRVDGGGSVDNLLMQMQADFAGIPVVRTRNPETTVLGAAYLAGLPPREAEVERVFEPRMSSSERGEKLSRWRRAVERAKGWAMLLVLLFLAGSMQAQNGLPLFDVFTQKTHNAGSQVFGAAQDPSGTLWFGTLRGVASYDGAWWRSIELPNESGVFAIAAGRGPEVAVGAVGELGYVTRDAQGTPVYRSLVPQLPAEFRDIGEVTGVCATGNGFLFISERAAIAWGGGAPRVAIDFRGVTNPHTRCASEDGAVWLSGGDGLLRLDARATSFAGKTIERVGGGIVAVRGEGLFRIDGTPFAAEGSEWLRDKSVVAIARAGDRLVVGTRQHGMLILGANGEIEQRLAEGSGLPSDVLSSALTDREGSVWLTYYGPIVRLDLATRVARLDERIGLHGSVVSVTRFDGKLYLATSHGLFVFDGPRANARRVEGIPAPVWSTIVVDGEILAGTGDGVFLGAKQIAGTKGIVFYDALQSTADPNLIWLTTKKGVATLHRDGGGWRYGGVIAGTPQYARGLHERDGALWFGTVFNGVGRLDARTRGGLRTFGSGEMLPAGIGGRMTLIASGRVSVLANDGRLVPDARLQHVKGNYFRTAEDARGNLWSNATPPQFIERKADGTYAEPVPLVSIDSANFQLVEADPDGTIWYGSDDSLYRYDSGFATARRPQPRPSIQRVTTADGKLVAAPLPPSSGRLRIEFAPLTYQPGVRYQYRLDDDDPWSEWTAQPFIDYTNVEPGEHLFRVRARNSAGSLSDDAAWRFSVLPPWYRTRAALLLWLVAAALIIAAIVRLRTTALRRQAARLQVLVEERTEELLQANAHLERLSLMDELTGIANRRYFQRALIEDWRNAFEHRQPLALVLIDLDHFKQLNDRYGHPAGDAALMQVARLLARQVRRSGDVPVRASDIVARIGGEEFAVLLAHTDESEAMHMAENLRAGIAASSELTASCGVAVMIPERAEGWDVLIRRADAALYAAKAAGRNCVRAGGNDVGETTSVAV